MDDESRRRRQNEQPQWGAPDSRYVQDQIQGRGFASGASDRSRFPPPLTSSSTASRTIAGPSSSYGYYGETPSTFSAALPANTMQYQAEFQSDQRQQQSLASYSSGMMYGVSQQASQAAVYDHTSQFSRQPAAMQMLSDVASPYYAGEPSNASVPPVLQHQASSSSTTSYQQSQADRNQLLQGYAGNMGGIGNLTAAAPEAMAEPDNYEASSLDQAYTTYQNALKQIFQNIRNNVLVEASESLLEVSDWLLTHVGDLADDEKLHGDRVRLWNEFNTAWLAVLQRQKDLMEELLQTGIALRPPQSLIPSDFINKMARDLIRLCDIIEKHGLVDYQYGVAEERIIAILEDCADLWEVYDRRAPT